MHMRRFIPDGHMMGFAYMHAEAAEQDQRQVEDFAANDAQVQQGNGSIRVHACMHHFHKKALLEYIILPMS